MKEKVSGKRHFGISVLFITLLFSLSFFAAWLGPAKTGFAIMTAGSGIDTSGPRLTGLLTLNFSSEVLIPLEAMLMISVDDTSRYYTLSKLLGSSVPRGSGMFYYPGSELDGEGIGYGIIGLNNDSAVRGFGKGFVSEDSILVQINISLFNITLPEYEVQLDVAMKLGKTVIYSFSYPLTLELQDVDEDGDGFSTLLDCDDSNPEINPDVSEMYYDGIDNDCNPSTIDNDKDGDGYPHPGDCNDTVDFVNPGRPELPGDGFDNDCDPETSDSLELANAGKFFPKDNISILPMTKSLVQVDENIQMMILPRLGQKPMPRPDNVILTIKDASEAPAVFTLADALRLEGEFASMEGSFNGTGFYFLNWTVFYRGNSYPFTEIVFVNDWDEMAVHLDKETTEVFEDTASYFDHLLSVLEHNSLLYGKDMKLLSEKMTRTSDLFALLADNNISLVSVKMELINNQAELRDSLSGEILKSNLESPYTENGSYRGILLVSLLMVAILIGLFLFNRIYISGRGKKTRKR